MPGFRHQAVIAAPPERVFAALADPATALATLEGMTKSVNADGAGVAVRAGSKIRQARTLSGRSVEALADVAVFRPGKEIEFVLDAQGLRAAYRYVLKPHEQGTQVVLEVNVSGSGLAALVAGTVSNALERADRDHLAKLAALIVRGSV